MDRKVSELCGKLYDMAKANQERRFYSLYDKMERMDVLKEAWESVRTNGGSPGIDGITIGKLKKDGIEPIPTEIETELLAGFSSHLTPTSRASNRYLEIASFIGTVLRR